MLVKATGKSIPLDVKSHDGIIQYVQTLEPQKRDAFLGAIEQVVDGRSQAMHVEPAQFIPTVSAVHENKSGRNIKAGKAEIKKST